MVLLLYDYIMIIIMILLVLLWLLMDYFTYFSHIINTLYYFYLFRYFSTKTALQILHNIIFDPPDCCFIFFAFFFHRYSSTIHEEQIRAYCYWNVAIMYSEMCAWIHQSWSGTCWMAITGNRYWIYFMRSVTHSPSLVSIKYHFGTKENSLYAVKYMWIYVKCTRAIKWNVLLLRAWR